MDRLFAEIDVSALDFVQVSAVFLLTILLFLDVKGRRHRWPGYFMLTIFALQSLLFIAFREVLRVKLFAALMLLPALLAVDAQRGGRVVRSDTTVEEEKPKS